MTIFGYKCARILHKEKMGPVFGRKRISQSYDTFVSSGKCLEYPLKKSHPKNEEKYAAKFDRPEKPKAPRIYEAHVGIASDKERIENFTYKNC